jgi:hypothetical protein
MNKYQLYANLVFLTHLVFVLATLASLPLVILFPAFRIVIIVLLVLTLLQWWIYKDHCLLTDLEKKFYEKMGQKPYTGGCIAHYLGELGLKVTNRQVTIFLYIYFALTIIMALVPHK